MAKKGILIDGMSLWFLAIGLIFFYIVFNFTGVVSANSLDANPFEIIESFGASSVLPSFLHFVDDYEGNEISTLELLDAYCYAEEKARESIKKALERRVRTLFNHRFASFSFRCSNGDEIALRKYLCEQPKSYGIVARDGKRHDLFFCAQATRIVTDDGAEWEQIYNTGKYIQLEPGESFLSTTGNQNTVV